MNYFKDYFHFSKKDRIGAIALIMLILLTYFIPFLFPSYSSDLKATTFFKTVDSLEKSKPVINSTVPKAYEKDKRFKKGELFAFDPNLLDSSGWLKLGLAPFKIKTILHYRNKGGRFYKVEDLEKIWGLPEGFYEYVKPYIKIASTKSVKAFEPKAKPVTHILDINDADSADFESLPCIGPVLSARIIKFRNKLGGFYSIEQVKETYGISDSVYSVISPFLKINLNELKLNKVNINTASKNQLKAHPYIKWNIANAIVEYRNQHGMYIQLNDLKKISIITDDVYRKLMPYLTIQ